MADLLLWALSHGQTIGLVAFLLAIPLALLGVALVAAQAGARWIVVFWIWRRFLRNRRGRGGRSREYEAFMASQAWRQQRGRVLRRDANRCVCGRRAQEVHHRWYARPIAATPDWALEALCRDCHQRAHGR